MSRRVGAVTCAAGIAMVGTVVTFALTALAPLPLTAQSLPYESMAARIVSALQVTSGERVLLRVDPNNLAALAPLVRAALQERGAVVDTLPYGPAPDFEARLARTDVYVWLPAPASATPAIRRVRCSAGLTAAKGASCTSTGSTARAMSTGCRRSIRPHTTVCMSTRWGLITSNSASAWMPPFRRCGPTRSK